LGTVSRVFDFVDKLFINFQKLSIVLCNLSEDNNFLEEMLAIVEKELFSQRLCKVIVDEFFDIVLFVKQIV